MTPDGKKKLIKSLAIAIEDWIDREDPNSKDGTDVGWIGDRTVELMATLAITALELNSDAQQYMNKEGLIVRGK